MRKKKILNMAIVFVFVIGLFSPNAYQSVQAQENQADNIQSDTVEVPTNRIIVKYKEGTDASFTPALQPQMQRVSAASSWSLVYVREMSNNAHVLQLPQRLSVEQVEAIAAQIETLPEVEYAEPDRIYKHSLTPNDPEYVNQWNYSGTWGINLHDAWNDTTGSSSVVIAVVDSGVTAHADLNNRLVQGYDFISYSQEANDGDGRDNDPSDPGDWITVSENASGYFAGCGVSNSSWHGTHVAGIIGAESNNNSFVAGVDWNAKILPVRVLGKCGGYVSDIVDGMRWAAGLTVSGVPVNANPANIINLSLGGTGTCSTTEQNAITEIVNAGVVVVAAAGNNNQNINATPYYSPANCTGVIAVAATDSSGQKSSFSNFGAGVDISAPGSDIISLVDTGTQGPSGDSYASYSGTSMAAPQVSGVLGLMFAINPDLAPAQALTLLQDSAKAFPGGGTCTTSNCGAGIVDAAAAVNLTQLPDLIITNVTLDPAEPVSGQPFDVLVTVKNQGGDNSGSIVYRDVWVDVDPRTLPDNNADGCPDSDSDYFRSDFNNSLPPGAFETLAVTIDNPTLTGSHQLWVYVDATCITEEGIEDNNVYGPIAVGDGPISVYIAEQLKGTYNLDSTDTVFDNYPSVLNGPVKVTGFGNFMTTQIVKSGESYNELAGYPVNQFTTEYWLPWYDHGYPNISGSKMRTWLAIGNPSNTLSANVAVYIGGVLKGSQTITPGSQWTPRWIGLQDGPVQVISNNPVFVSERVFTVPDNSFNESMAYPANQFTTEYWFPWYDTVYMNSSLMIGNTSSSQTATVDVYIGTTKYGTYNIAPNDTLIKSYSNVVNGPVRVVSVNGINIVTSQRVLSGPKNSYNEVSGYPYNQFTNEYWFPYYDHGYPVVSGSNMRTWLAIGNPSNTLSANVQVYIGGILKDSQTITPGSQWTPRWIGLQDGPVQVISNNPVFVSERVFTVPSNVFNEMLAYAANQVAVEYWFPWYDSIYMNTSIAISRP